MFENLLGQDEVKAQLVLDIGSGRLPNSLLFAGPPASGKMTAALELARVLSCKSPGPARATWNCPCTACARHRVLAHQDLLLLGPRHFPEEIPAALDLLEHSPGKASAYFFIRAVRKLCKRFDAALFEGEEARLAKAAPLLREIEERLDLIAPEALAETDGEAARKAFEAARSITDTARKLEAQVADTTPVFMIRAAGYWARLSASGLSKTIVIEGADRMLDGSRNALLKILEEPPESLEFVLLSSRRNALLATITSRVRPYAFKARSPAEEAVVLERIFKKTPGASGEGRQGAAIEAFLQAHRAFPPEEARRRARTFLLAAAARREGRGALDPALAALARPAASLRTDFDPAIAALVDSGASPAEIGDAALATLAAETKDFGAKDDAFASSFLSFLLALSGLLGEALRLPRLGPDGILMIEDWAALIRDAKTQYETLNRSPSLLVESLLYAMGGAATP